MSRNGPSHGSTAAKRVLPLSRSLVDAIDASSIAPRRHQHHAHVDALVTFHLRQGWHTVEQLAAATGLSVITLRSYVGGRCGGWMTKHGVVSKRLPTMSIDQGMLASKKIAHGCIAYRINDEPPASYRSPFDVLDRK